MAIAYLLPQPCDSALQARGLRPSGVVARALASLSPDFASKLKPAIDLAAAGKTDDALKQIAALIAIEDKAAASSSAHIATTQISGEHLENKALAELAAGGVAERAGRDAEALAHYGACAKLDQPISDYAHAFAGFILQAQNRPEEARKEFQAALETGDLPPTSALELKTRLGQIAAMQKNWKASAALLRPLLKKLRGTPFYSDALLLLYRSDRRGRSACKLARELYSRYPTLPALAAWGYDLKTNKIDGESVACSADSKDFQARIRRLQWGGDSERALKELQAARGKPLLTLASKAPAEPADGAGGSSGSESLSESGAPGAAPDADEDPAQYSVDSMLASYFVAEGRVDEALKILLSHYAEFKQRPQFLLQVARAAARAGEYETAVGSFYRAYQLSPRGKDAKDALFQAAFMSYQFQDYDGATRKFEQFTSVFPTSRLSRDAHWHLAWIRYLRGDYDGALEGFSRLEKLKFPVRRARRGRRRRSSKPPSAPDSFSGDRIQYWKAMSLLRLGRIQDASAVFQKLAHDPAYGYYGVAAFYRLASLPGLQAPLKAELANMKKGGVGQLTEEELKEAQKAQAEEAASEAQSATAQNPDASPDAAVVGAADDSSDTADSGSDSGADSGSAADTDSDSESESNLKSLKQSKRAALAPAPSPAKAASSAAAEASAEAKIVRRFDLARALSAAGFGEPARRELAEIERRARSSEDRRALMTEYARLGNWYRASVLGELAFGPERLRGGLRNERSLWEFAYPRAYPAAVASAIKQAAVPDHLVWSIMRAESHYRQDAFSSTGALGLMQMMPFTGRKVAGLLGLEASFQTGSLLDPDVNIRLGARYLLRLSEGFRGSVPLVAAAYNAGPHRVAAWLKAFGLLDMDEFIEHIPFIETRDYVKKVVRNFQIYGLLYSNAGRSMKWLARPVDVTIDPSAPPGEIW